MNASGKLDVYPIRCDHDILGAEKVEKITRIRLFHSNMYIYVRIILNFRIILNINSFYNFKLWT